MFKKEITCKKVIIIISIFLSIFLSVNLVYAFMPSNDYDTLPDISNLNKDRMFVPASEQSKPYFSKSLPLPEFFKKPLPDIKFMSKIAEATMNFFVKLRDEKTGLFVDAGNAADETVDLGIASTGLGLTALVMGAEYSLIDKNEARKWVNQALDTLLDMQEKQIKYEKELIAYLEEKAEIIADQDILDRLEKKGMEEELLKAVSEEEKQKIRSSYNWQRFSAIEQLREKYELDFLKDEIGLKNEYNHQLNAFLKDGKGTENDFEKIYLRENSSIYLYGRWGFFYRYMGRKSALPQRSVKEGLNDLSTIDSVIGVLGVLTSGYYFGQDTQEKAEEIYRNMQWDLMIGSPINDGTVYSSYSNYISMGWVPEPVNGKLENAGFLSQYWNAYTDETLIVTLLAMGSPAPEKDSLSSLIFDDDSLKSPGKEIYDGFKKPEGSNQTAENIIFTPEGGLWSYNLNLWIDTHDKIDSDGINWYNNAVKAVLSNRDIVINMEDSKNKTLLEQYDTFNYHLWPITTMMTCLNITDSLWKQSLGSGYDNSGYHMDIGVVIKDFAPANLDKIPPIVAPNGYMGSIIHSLYSYMGLRFLSSTDVRIWKNEDGFRDAFSYDIGWGEIEGKEWYSPTTITFSQGLFLQMFNLMGELSRSEIKDKKSIWEITNSIPYIQDAFRKAGFSVLPEKENIPYFLDDRSEGIKSINEEIKDIVLLIENGKTYEALDKFNKIASSDMVSENITEKDFDEIIKTITHQIDEFSEYSSLPLLYYMRAEAYISRIRNISLAATGRKYLSEKPNYKTFEAVKYYFNEADKYYSLVWKDIFSAEGLLEAELLEDQDTVNKLETQIKALQFVLFKNTFRNYELQKELFKETAQLLSENHVEISDYKNIAMIIYRYDWEAELSGAISLEDIIKDLKYYEKNYDFRNVRTPVYKRLEGE